MGYKCHTKYCTEIWYITALLLKDLIWKHKYKMFLKKSIGKNFARGFNLKVHTKCKIQIQNLWKKKFLESTIL